MGVILINSIILFLIFWIVQDTRRLSLKKANLETFWFLLYLKLGILVTTIIIQSVIFYIVAHN